MREEALTHLSTEWRRTAFSIELIDIWERGIGTAGVSRWHACLLACIAPGLRAISPVNRTQHNSRPMTHQYRSLLRSDSAAASLPDDKRGRSQGNALIHSAVEKGMTRRRH